MIRKVMALALVGVLAMGGLIASPAHAQEKNVLMVLWRGITEPEEAFKAKLAELGVAVKYTEIVGDQDRGVLAERLRAAETDIKAKKYDVIYSFGTTTTQVTQQVVQEAVPIVFNIVFDPVGGKLVKSLEQPGGNTTGVTNGVPINDQLNAFMTLSPFKSLILFFNAREPNANIIEAQVSEWAAAKGVSVTARRVVPDTDSLTTVLEEIKSGALTAEAAYAGADSFLGSKAGEIQAAIGDKVRLFGGTQTFVLRKWLAAYTPPVSAMGGTAAEQVAKVLGGAPAGTLPVILPTPRLIMSKSAAEAHKVTVPADALTEN
ncbi:ABC transporter substrate binding protein [Pararhodospirillum photometricum]|nr:ABC transporter substrate binding protein [Pararhodospirillum photometricum]